MAPDIARNGGKFESISLAFMYCLHFGLILIMTLHFEIGNVKIVDSLFNLVTNLNAFQ